MEATQVYTRPEVRGIKAVHRSAHSYKKEDHQELYESSWPPGQLSSLSSEPGGHAAKT